MGILEALQLFNNAGETLRATGNISEKFAPVNEFIDKTREGIGDFFGDTETKIDDGDGSEYKILDNQSLDNRFDNLAEVSSNLMKMPPPNMNLLQNNPQTPINFNQQMANPYAPVSYMGPQTNADAAMMQQYAPQNMSMQQIMTMLKRAGY